MELNTTYNGTQYQAYTADALREKGVPEDIILEAIKVAEMADVLDKRKSAYKTEADPLYLEWQYDGTAEKEQAWRDKVAEIKARYPLPSES